MTDVTARLHAALERIRPALQMDGGDVELLGWEPDRGAVRVTLTGACASGCAGASTTTVLGVERVLKQLVPEVRLVEMA